MTETGAATSIMGYGKKNGYDLACHVLRHEHGGVEELLRLAGNDESCWLEMKAGMELLPEDRDKGEKSADLYWKIARAAIEIMNTSGGVLLIGIHDKTHNVVPLEENDRRDVIANEGLEAYRRKEILERICPKNNKWETSKGNWILDPLPEPGSIEVVGCEYQRKNIAAVLIKPAGKCVHFIRIKDQIESEYLFARERGEIGKAIQITRFNEIAEYESKREIETAFLGELYARFEREVGERSEAGILDRAIRQYYERFTESVREKRYFELSCFTPLDGSGNLEEINDFVSPQAEENFDPLESESDDWLNPENDDERNEDEDKLDREDDDENEDSAYREHRSGDLIALMEEIPRMLVLGEPGGGKTTTLINFTLRFRPVEDIHGEPPVLAVYIPMGRWIAGGSIEQLLNKSTGLSPGQWSFLIRQNRLRLVIDAFNECPDMYQDAALLNIRKFLQAHPDLPAVISSRTTQRLKELCLPMFTVEPMDQEHQKKYLTRYLNDETAAEELLNRLNAMSGGTMLAANPMLLRMIVEVFRDSHQLPSGRAGLYHQWLEQWYDREYRKAKKAGSPLPWDFHAALDILSELALRGRYRGYRDIPLAFAREILQDRGPECIDKLCQGPVVMIDDEFIRFRHETFQEYLCAEKLIQKPELVEQIKKADAGQWAMVLAYASELQWPLPDAMWRFAWKVDPWLGIALTDNQRSDIINMTAETPQKKIYFHALRGTWESGLPLKKVLKGNFWYSADIRKVIYYIISANEEICNRWTLFELWQLAYCNESWLLFRFSRYSIVIISALECKHLSIDKWVASYLCHPNIQKDLAIKLDDFHKKINKWIYTSPKQAGRFIDHKLVMKEDVLINLDHWIKSATFNMARRLLRLGWVTKDTFPDTLVIKWRKGAKSPKAARRLINAGFATKEDFADKISKWILNASPHRAKLLIESGLAQKDDFENTRNAKISHMESSNGE